MTRPEQTPTYWSPVRILDGVLAAVLCLLAVLLAVAAAVVSALFPAGSDQMSPVAVGWAIAWTGAAVGSIGACVRVVLSARRASRWPLLLWPLAGLALIVLSFLVGVSIADRDGIVW